MKKNGFPGVRLQFERDRQGKPVFHVVRGKGNKSDYSRQTGGKVNDEIQAHFGDSYDLNGATTTLVFQNLADWDAESFSDLAAAFYGRWNGDNGLCWVVDYPFFKVENLKDTSRTLWVNNDRNISLAQLTTVEMGGVAHELGHALSLPPPPPRAAGRTTTT